MTFHFKPPTTANPGPSPQAAAPQTPSAMTPELMSQIGELRSKIQISIGQTLLAMMDLPRYKHISLADFAHLGINPLLRNRVAIAHKSITESRQTKVDEESIAGIAIYATVSPAVDAKIAEQTKAGVFPIRLNPEDWTSGDMPWRRPHPGHIRTRQFPPSSGRETNQDSSDGGKTD
jgi:cytolysin-activating lysine-acyltransferase